MLRKITVMEKIKEEDDKYKIPRRLEHENKLLSSNNNYLLSRCF